MQFIESILPLIKVGFKVCECTHLTDNCVAAPFYFYLPPTRRPHRKSWWIRDQQREGNKLNTLAFLKPRPVGAVIVCSWRGFPLRQHQCGLLFSLSGFQSNCICLNDVNFRKSKRNQDHVFLWLYFYSNSLDRSSVKHLDHILYFYPSWGIPFNTFWGSDPVASTIYLWGVSGTCCFLFFFFKTSAQGHFWNTTLKLRVDSKSHMDCVFELSQRRLAF